MYVLPGTEIAFKAFITEVSRDKATFLPPWAVHIHYTINNQQMEMLKKQEMEVQVSLQFSNLASNQWH